MKKLIFALALSLAFFSGPAARAQTPAVLTVTSYDSKAKASFSGDTMTITKAPPLGAGLSIRVGALPKATKTLKYFILSSDGGTEYSLGESDDVRTVTDSFGYRLQLNNATAPYDYKAVRAKAYDKNNVLIGQGDSSFGIQLNPSSQQAAASGQNYAASVTVENKTSPSGYHDGDTVVFHVTTNAPSHKNYLTLNTPDKTVIQISSGAKSDAVSWIIGGSTGSVPSGDYQIRLVVTDSSAKNGLYVNGVTYVPSTVVVPSFVVSPATDQSIAGSTGSKYQVSATIANVISAKGGSIRAGDTAILSIVSNALPRDSYVATLLDSSGNPAPASDTLAMVLLSSGKRKRITFQKNFPPGDYRFLVTAYEYDGALRDGPITVGTALTPVFTVSPAGGSASVFDAASSFWDSLFQQQ